jgi:uncharacterized protein (TIGR03435 family)
LLGHEFEVASIKPAAPQEIGRTSTRMSSNTDSGSLVYSNANLKQILGRAFNVQQYQLTGPSFMETERFDVTASFAPQSTSEQLSSMLQKLLADRFGLKVHRETKELPAFALTIIKGGPKFKSAESDAGVSSNSNGSRWRMTAKITMRRLAEILTEQAGRPVHDQTDLTGPFDLTLEWSAGEAIANDRDAPPSVFTALQEQLGLKLEPIKAPVESIVVDQLQRIPTEN